jgi:acetylxylan esterase
MHFFLLSFILPLVAVAQTPPAACPPVHIIVARASGEPQGEGIIGSLASTLKQQIPGATSEALVYPAKIPYVGSISVGVTNMKAAIANYTQSCATGKLVILGYSQGAAVLTDTLCGGGGPDIGPNTSGVTTEEGRLLKAAVGMGDPRFVPGTSYDAGTNKNMGGVSSVLSFAIIRERKCISATDVADTHRVGCHAGQGCGSMSYLGVKDCIVLRCQRFALCQRV